MKILRNFSIIDIKEDDSDVFIFQEMDNSWEVEKYLKDNNLSITDLKTHCNRHYLQEVILNLRKKTQLSIRGIADLLGLNIGIVQRMRGKKNEYLCQACQRTVPSHGHWFY
ncbi:MAG: hypothetical protein VR72_06900 [Clostridiaceae bacterium BRH_c20a]|nr:MAG: hypothetical protein VR72_06900 [Clostridiaceae bacterium BRH_c20a]